MPRVADNPRRIPRSYLRRRASLFVLALALLGGLGVAGFALITDPDVLGSSRVRLMTDAQMSESREQTVRLMFIGTLIFLSGPLLVAIGAISSGLVRLMRRLTHRPYIAQVSPHPTLPLHIPHVSLKVADTAAPTPERRRVPTPGAQTTMVQSA